jgi:hypothetical protein
VRAVDVVLGNEPIHRGLRDPPTGGLVIVEQVAAQRQVEPLHLAGRIRDAGAVSRCVIAFLRQILSNNTSPPLPNPPVNCLPLSVSTRRDPKRWVNTRHTTQPVARSTTTAAITQNWE